MSKDKEYIREQSRRFSAHHILLGSAHMALEHAREEQPGWFYSELIAITMCGLALESLANAFGERIVYTWKDFENSSPAAKLRVICSQLEIVPDFSKEPWSCVPWLTKFRNRVAHAKPELVKEETLLTKEEYDNRHKTTEPKSKLESDVTLPNAERAYAALVQIKQILCESMPKDELEGLYADEWSGETRPIDK